MTRHLTWLAMASLAALSGCFGGGGDDGGSAPSPDPLAAVPDSARASAAGFVAYLRALTGTTPEDRAPVSLEGFEPPASEDGVPEPLS